MSERYSKNVPGPFYVEDGCCISCAIPMTEAPELFSMDDNHCYVKRQPETQQEIDKAIEMIWSSELDCIRYAGCDKSILRRLGEAGLADQADDTFAYNFEPRYRDRVTFRWCVEKSKAPGHVKLAESFRSYLRSEGTKIQLSSVGSRSVSLS